jgi:hypothetical protein
LEELESNLIKEIPDKSQPFHEGCERGQENPGIKSAKGDSQENISYLAYFFYDR